MKKWIGLILLCTGAGLAQDNALVWKQRVFDMKYIDPRPMADLIGNMQKRGDSRVNANVPLRVVSVGTYEDGLIPLAEELVKRYDVPSANRPTLNPRNVELVTHLILAAPAGSSGTALPSDLDGVAKQLKAVFGYADLKLLDAVVLRTREELEGAIDGNSGKFSPEVPDYINTRYTLNFKSLGVAQQDKANLIKIDRLRFNIRIPYALPSTGQPQYQFQEIGFMTNLDIREGQKVVVAKNKIDNSDKALILVVSAKVVD
jgi:hypothetical protein